MMQIVTLEDGKYQLRFDEASGALCAYRYGEPWQDFTGNKFIYLLMQEALKAVPSEAYLSWAGNNVRGDLKSINTIKDIMHSAGTVPELRKRIQDMDAEISALKEELEVCVDLKRQYQDRIG